MYDELAVLGAKVLIGIVLLIVWSGIWKGIALYRAGFNRQKAWFVVMFLLNTVGILEIIYLAFFQRIRVAPKPISKTIPKQINKAVKKKK